MSVSASAYGRFAEHGELTLGVFGGFLLAALVLVLQNRTNFETLGEPYFEALIFIMSVGIFSSIFGSSTWSFIAAQTPNEKKRETGLNRYALFMTSLTTVMLLFAIPMLVAPFNLALGILIWVIGFLMFGVQFYLSSKEASHSEVVIRPRSNSSDGRQKDEENNFP